MKKASNGYYGFTIVELLIVIVVIGVLAAITTNVFNGIQKRAQDTQVIAHVNQWSKIINSYAVLKGEYPQPGLGSNGSYCLGVLLPKEDFANGECDKSMTGANNSSHLEAILKDSGVPYPVADTSIVRYGTGGFYDMRGLILRTNDSKVRNYKITYSLQQEKCPAGDGIGYQESDDGRGISGTSPPGLYGRKKLCVRNLTDL